ncbi:unnamed protein product [Leuciscus chuanchicus]
MIGPGCNASDTSCTSPSKIRKELKKAQAEHHLPFHRLITETPTRWGSRQMMIQRVLEQEKALSQVLKANRKTKHLIYKQDPRPTAGIHRHAVWRSVRQCVVISFFKKASRGCTAALADIEAIEMELKSFLQTMQVDGETNPLDWALNGHPRLDSVMYEHCMLARDHPAPALRASFS